MNLLEEEEVEQERAEVEDWHGGGGGCCNSSAVAVVGAGHLRCDGDGRWGSWEHSWWAPGNNRYFTDVMKATYTSNENK